MMQDLTRVDVACDHLSSTRNLAHLIGPRLRRGRRATLRIAEEGPGRPSGAACECSAVEFRSGEARRCTRAK